MSANFPREGVGGVGGSSTFFNLKSLVRNQIHYFDTIICEAKTINGPYVDFPAQINKSMH